MAVRFRCLQSKWADGTVEHTREQPRLSLRLSMNTGPTADSGVNR